MNNPQQPFGGGGDIIYQKDYESLRRQHEERMARQPVPIPGWHGTYHPVDEQGKINYLPGNAYRPSYVPTYWEDPRHVAYQYWRYRNQPAGTPLPENVDTNFLKSAYDYFKMANGTDDWTQWKYLNNQDPARDFLKSGTMPPLVDVLNPEVYQNVLFSELYQQPEGEYDPVVLSTLPPDMQYALTHKKEVEQQALEWEESAPLWLKGYRELTSDPMWSPMWNMFPMVLWNLKSGNVAGAGFTLANAYVQSLLSQLSEEGFNKTDEEKAKLWEKVIASGLSAGTLVTSLTVPFAKQYGVLAGALAGTGAAAYTAITGNALNDEMLSLLDSGALFIERILGTAAQFTGALRDPEKWGTPQELVENFEATWKAAGLFYEGTSVPGQNPMSLLNMVVPDSVLKQSQFKLLSDAFNPMPYDNWINVFPLLNLAYARLTGNEEEAAKVKFAKEGETFWSYGGWQYGAGHEYDPNAPPEANMFTADPQRLQTTYAIATAQLRRQLANNMVSGVDMDMLTRYYGQEFGISGEMKELVGHIALDLLNVAPQIESKVVGSAAKLAGQSSLAFAYNSAPRLGLFGNLRNFRSMVWTGQFDIKTDGARALSEEMGLVEPPKPVVEPSAEVVLNQTTPVPRASDTAKSYMDRMWSTGRLNKPRYEMRKYGLELLDKLFYSTETEKEVILDKKDFGYVGAYDGDEWGFMKYYALKHGYFLTTDTLPSGEAGYYSGKLLKLEEAMKTPEYAQKIRDMEEYERIKFVDTQEKLRQENVEEKVILELFGAAKTASGHQYILTPFEKFVAGLSERGIPWEYDPQFIWKVQGEGKLAAVQNAVLRFVKPMLRMNPESQAMWALAVGTDNYNNIANNFRGDIDKFTTAWKQIAMNPAQASAQFNIRAFGSPIMYTLQQALQRWIPNMDNLVEIYNGFKNERSMLNQIASVMDVDAGKLLGMMSEKEGVAKVWQQLETDIKAGEKAGGKSLDAKIKSGELTPDYLKTLTEIFDADTGISWHPDQFMAKELANSYMDSVEKWARDAYGVEPMRGYNKLWDALKKAQSIFLLNYNPAYLVNNVVNNLVSRMATGIFGNGYATSKTLGNYWGRMGLVPSRYYAGLGAAQNLPEGVVKKGLHYIGRPFGESPSKVGVEALRRDMKGHDGRLDIVSRGLDKLMKLGVTNKLSQAMERVESKQAEYVACKQAMDRLWRSGKNVPKMSKALKNALIAEIGRDAPDWLSSAIRSSLSREEITAKILAGNPTFDIDYALDRTLSRLGIDKELAMELLSKGNILEILADNIKDVKDDAGLDVAFSKVKEHFADEADKMTVKDLKTRAEAVRAEVELGKFNSATALLDELNTVLSEFELMRWIDKDLTRGRDMEMREREALDWNYIRQNWKGLRVRSMREWKRMRNFQLASIDGILKGIGFENSKIDNYVTNMAEIIRLNEEFYLYEDGKYDTFYNTAPSLTRAERQVEYEKLKSTLDFAYDEMQKKIIGWDETKEGATIHHLGLNEVNANSFVEAVKLQYGDTAAELARIWADDINDYAKKRYASFTEQRKLTDTLPLSERRKSYMDFFHQTFKPEMLKHYNEQTAKGVNMFNHIHYGAPLQQPDTNMFSLKLGIFNYERFVSTRPPERYVASEALVKSNADLEEARLKLLEMDKASEGYESAVKEWQDSVRKARKDAYNEYSQHPDAIWSYELLDRLKMFSVDIARRGVRAPDDLKEVIRNLEFDLESEIIPRQDNLERAVELLSDSRRLSQDGAEEMIIRDNLNINNHNARLQRSIAAENGMEAPYSGSAPMPIGNNPRKTVLPPQTRANVTTESKVRDWLRNRFLSPESAKRIGATVDEQVDVIMAILNAHAMEWSRRNDTTPDAWFASRIAEITRAGADERQAGTILEQDAREVFFSSVERVLEEPTFLKKFEARQNKNGEVDKKWLRENLTADKSENVFGSQRISVKESELVWMGYDQWFSDKTKITLKDMKEFAQVAKIRVTAKRLGALDTTGWRAEQVPPIEKWYDPVEDQWLPEPQKYGDQWEYIERNVVDGGLRYAMTPDETVWRQYYADQGFVKKPYRQTNDRWNVYDNEGNWVDAVTADTPEQAVKHIAMYSSINKPQYGSYTISGTKEENYHELVFYIPTTYKPTYKTDLDLKVDMEAVTARLDDLGQRRNEVIRNKEAGWEEEAEKLQKEFIEVQRAEKVLLNDYFRAQGKAYSAPHFGSSAKQENLMFHIRYSENWVDSDGKKVLYIEELQSDMLQVFRDITEMAPELMFAMTEDGIQQYWQRIFARSEADLPKLLEGKETYLFPTNEQIDDARVLLRERYDEIMDATPELVRAKEEYQKAHDDWDGFDDNPNMTAAQNYLARTLVYQRYRAARENIDKVKGEVELKDRKLLELRDMMNRTEDIRQLTGSHRLIAYGETPLWKGLNQAAKWQRMAMLYMLRHAAENGYDRLGWSKGAVHTKRWGSRQVSWERGFDVFDEQGHPVDVKSLIALGVTDYQTAINNKDIIDKGWTVMDYGIKVKGESGEEFTIKPETLKPPELVTLEAEIKGLEESIAKLEASKADKATIDGAKASLKELVARHREESRIADMRVSAVLKNELSGYGSLRRANILKEMKKTPKGEKDVFGGFEVIYDKVMMNIADEIYKDFGNEDTGTGESKLNPGAYKEQPYWFLNITKEMTDSATNLKNKGLSGIPLLLPQAQPETGKPLPRAQVEWNERGQAIIKAIKNTDVSSAIHEFIHVWEVDLPTNDRYTINEWWSQLGLDARYDDNAKVVGTQWKEAREALAKGGEKYIMDGSFPSSQMKSIFMKLAAWIRDIYRNISGYEFPDVTPEMKEVYARMMGLLNERLGITEGQPRVDGEVAPGVPENMAPPLYRSQSEGELWKQNTEPIIDGIHESLKETGMTGGYKIPSSLMPDVNKYLNNVSSELTSTKSYAVDYANQMRDWALLNYSEKRGFDNALQLLYPYQFWYTRTAWNWLQRAVDKPYWFANFYKLRKFMRQREEEAGYPTRLQNRMSVYAPYLPDWTGDKFFTDPLNNLFPFENFVTPIREFKRIRTDQIRSAQYVLQKWVDDETITAEEAYNAGMTQTGELWEKAIAQAEEEAGADAFNPLGYLDAIMSPAMYLTYPYYFATGKTLSMEPRPDLPLLPMTRTGKAVETIAQDTPLEQVGKWVGDILSAPETAFRRGANSLFNTNMSEFGDWGEYYIERQIANMVRSGEASLRDAKLAMIDNKGAVWDEAQRRAMLENAMRVPGALPAYAATHGANAIDMVGATMFGMAPAGLLPPAELETKQLKDEYEAARLGYNNGDLAAFESFFEAHPEYAARMALFEKPEDRLRQFLITETWDAWQELGSVQKEQMEAAFGEQFSVNFLDKETRNYDKISDEVLAFWANKMGAMIPESVVPEESEGYREAPAMPAGIEDEVNAYRKIRNAQFPNWYALQQRYFGLPEGQQRKDFLSKFPVLKEYWDWNKKYKESHPEISMYAEEYKPSEYDYTFMQEFSVPLLRQLFQYYLNDVSLSEGALSELQRIWELSDRQGGTFEEFIEVVVRPKLIP